MASVDISGAEFHDPCRKELLQALKDVLRVDTIRPTASGVTYSCKGYSRMYRIKRKNNSNMDSTKTSSLYRFYSTKPFHSTSVSHATIAVSITAATCRQRDQRRCILTRPVIQMKSRTSIHSLCDILVQGEDGCLVQCDILQSGQDRGVDILQVPSLSASNQGPNSTMLFNVESQHIIRSGDQISLKTDDPVSRPLPDFRLLEMQWFLHCVTAMSGAAEPWDDFHDEGSDDGITTAPQDQWDIYTEDKWDMETEEGQAMEHFWGTRSLPHP
ncbi:hypothetical protein CC78DRAFT_572870 [Lojkania enalia]|uniref:Uncharacterized protein n=1 Tax=Lojkania enalia TaxID=147567 RepID=A0A9P4MX57_9PLEO|nr:hypothetical protein CC78DRAFT_572870 [Didymosphaeria enalia]